MRWIKFTKDLCILVEELLNSMVFEGLVPLLSVWVKVHSLGLLFPLKQFCAWFMRSFGSVVILCFILFSPFLCLHLEESTEANPGEIFQSNPEPNCWWQSCLSHGSAASQSGARLGQPLQKPNGRIIPPGGEGESTKFFSDQLSALVFKDTVNGWNCSSWF